MKTPLSVITIVVAAIFALCTLSYAQDISLQPDISFKDLQTQKSYSPLGFNEPALGRQLFRKIRGTRPLIEDPELKAWLNRLMERLTRATPALRNKLHFAIEDNPAINAYALRGGIIIVNSGLILSTESESELAAVLAHEIAHISQRHLTRMAAESPSNPLLTGLGILAGAAVASKNPDAGRAIITGTAAFQAQQQITYTQKYEQEADRVGLRILSSAGLAPQGFARFLEKLESSENSVYGDLRKYLQSHPLTIERLSDTRHRIRQLGKRQASESPDYQFAREKLRKILKHNHIPSSAKLTPSLTRYQQALTQHQRGNYSAVLKVLGQNSQQLPEALLIMNALNAQQRFPEAERLARQFLQRYPDHEALTIELANALHGKGQTQTAWQLYRRQHITDATSLQFLEQAQRMSQLMGFQSEAIGFSAERNFRMGQYRLAQLSVKKALSTQNIAPEARSRLQFKLDEIRRAQQEQALLKN